MGYGEVGLRFLLNGVHDHDVGAVLEAGIQDLDGGVADLGGQPGGSGPHDEDRSAAVSEVARALLEGVPVVPEVVREPQIPRRSDQEGGLVCRGPGVQNHDVRAAHRITSEKDS